MSILDGIETLDQARREDRMILAIKQLEQRINSFEHTLKWTAGALFIAGLGLFSTLIAHYLVGGRP